MGYCFGPSAWELTRDTMRKQTTRKQTTRKRSSTRPAGFSTQNHALPHSELSDLLVLQQISSELISERSTRALYERIVDAAVAIMHSDYASMQMLYPERGTGGELRLLAFRGFNPKAAQFWEWVRADSKSTCGLALRTGRRVLAPDIETSEFMSDSEDQKIYLQTGIRACQTTPLVSRGGNIVGMISTHWHTPHQPSVRDLRLFDILARQAADLIERTRREQELAQRAALLDLSTDAIIVRDLAGLILYWNRGAEQLYGWLRDEALGKNIHSLLHTRFPAPLNQIEDELFRTGRWNGELIQTRRDGQVISVLCRKSLDRNANGKSPTLLETTTDISERKRIDEQVKEQEERFRKTEKIVAAGRLAASLAHEINNPLTSVGNILYIVGHRPGIDNETKAWMSTAEAELTRVSRIVKQSLSYYRSDTSPKEVDLPTLVEESIQIFSDRLTRQGVDIVKTIAPGLSIVCFAGEIRQVVDNLLLNAAEATPPHGRLAISLRRSRNWSDHSQKGVRLTIADTGCGIPKEHLCKIFEPFFTTKPEKGTGLGLWVVQGIVAKHGGNIRVRSAAAGKKTGTVVSVLWPSSLQRDPIPHAAALSA